MFDSLEAFISKKRMAAVSHGMDEAKTKQAYILPLLQLLSWDPFDIEEVVPEYASGEGRVDYALCLNGTPGVFIEVKKLGLALEGFEEQLLNYSFKVGVEIAVLTNGILWLFYLPLRQGDWQSRKFYAIDIVEQDTDEVACRFLDFLGKESVSSGAAKSNAEEVINTRKRERVLERSIPDAWKKLIDDPDDALIELLISTTESLCGFAPDTHMVARYLLNMNLDRDKKPSRPSPVKFQPQTHVEKGETRKTTKKTSPHPDEHVKQDKLIDEIVLALGKRGGTATKKDVQEALFEKYRDLWEKPHYQEFVANGIHRWIHNIAWAKEAAKTQGYVMPPSESGHGTWKLTEKGISRYQRLNQR